MKRMISMLLVLAMLFSMVPVGSWAEEATPEEETVAQWEETEETTLPEETEETVPPEEPTEETEGPTGETEEETPPETTEEAPEPRTWEDWTYRILDDGTVSICGFHGTWDDAQKPFLVKVPAQIDHAPVTKIEAGAFAGNAQIEGVLLPETVLTVGDGAFENCTQLKVIGFLGDVPSLGDRFAPGTENLREILVLEEADVSGLMELLDLELGEGKVEVRRFADQEALEAVFETPWNDGTIRGQESFDAEEIVAAGVCNRFVYWKLNAKGLLTIYGSGDMEDYDYNRHSPWDGYRSRIKSVVIGEYIYRIGNWSFLGCGNLTAVTISNSVISIGTEAFAYCKNLANIAIPDSVTSIGDSTFESCTGLTNITIPNGVTSIGNSAFSGCTGLTSIAIPNGVTSIGREAFYGCKNLIRIAIPDSVASIGMNAFSGCEALTSITIPNSMNSILYGTFLGCVSLTSVTIPDSVTSIGNCIFYDCASLTDIIIPNSVTSIGSGVFYGCTSLTNLTIPNSVTSISNGVFYGCKALKSIIIPKSVASIGDSAFKDCNSLADVYFLGQEYEWNAVQIEANNEPLFNAQVYFQKEKSNPASSMDYLALSNLAYQDWRIGETVYEHLKDRWDQQELGKEGLTCRMLYDNIWNWTVVETSDNCAKQFSAGFYAVTFQGETTDGTEIVIAYRGSTDLAEALKSADGNDDWFKNDLPFQVNHTFTPQLQNALDYYQYCQDTVESGGITAVTGHSLGGGLAQIVSMTYGVYGELFNPAWAFEALYYHRPEIAAENFLGVNCWNFKAHIIDLDHLVGAYMGKFFAVPYVLYRRDGKDFPHNLSSFIHCNGDGTVSFSTIIGQSDGSKTPYANHFATSIDTNELYLGTSGKDSHVLKCANLFTAGFSKSTAYGGAGDDKIVLLGPGNDKIIGGKSNNGDFLDGNLGNDAYYYSIGDGEQWILDCQGNDTIYLLGYREGHSFDFRPKDRKVGLVSYGTIYCDGYPIIHISSARSGKMTVVMSDGERWEIGASDWKKVHKTARVACPVDVDILDADNNVVLTLQNNTEETTYTPYGCFYVFTDENGESVKYFNMMEGYNFRIRGVDAGTMDVSYILDEGEPMEIQNVPVTAKMTAYVTEDAQPVLALDNNSDGRVDEAFLFGTDMQPQVQLNQSYITLPLGTNMRLLFQTYPEALGEFLQWSVTPIEGENVITVDQDGTIHAHNAGAAYAVASVTANGTTYTARCRVDVTEQKTSAEVQGVQLGTTSLTAELFRKDYASFDVVLLLEQNQSEIAAFAQSEESGGVAITDARFEEETVDGLFELRVKDDRTLLVVPRQAALEAPKDVKGSYSSKVCLQIGEETFVTDQSLKLTVKKSMPKLKAAALSFNAFYTDRSQPIEITGGTVTAVIRDENMDTAKTSALPDWLELEDGRLILNELAPAKAASGNVYVQVETAEWANPVALKIPVKLTYGAPKLKLSATSVTFASANSRGVTLKLQCGNRADTLESLQVEDAAAEGFDVTLDRDTGDLTLVPDGEMTAGNKELWISFADTARQLCLKWKAVVQAPVLTANPKSVTLNGIAGDSIQIPITVSPADYQIRSIDSFLADSKGNTLERGLLNFSFENGTVSVRTTERTQPGSTYYLHIRIPEMTKDAVITVKTVAQKQSVITVTAKASGGIDRSFPESAAVVTPTFRNYASGSFTLDSWTLREYEGKNLVTEKPENWEISVQNGRIIVKAGQTANLNAKHNYTLDASLLLENGQMVQISNVKIPVKYTPVNLKLSKTSITLNPRVGDSDRVTVACQTKDYDFQEPLVQLDGSGLDFDWADGVLAVNTNADTAFGTTYRVSLQAKAGEPVSVLTVKTPAASKAAVSAKLTAKGSIDVVRDGTAVVVTPKFTNCASWENLEPKLTVEWATSEKNASYTTVPEGMFTVTENEDGTFAIQKTPGATPDLGCQYRAALSFRGGNPAYGKLTLKSGTGKVTAAGAPVLYKTDRFSRGIFQITSADGALNPVDRVTIKDARQQALFCIYDYGNGEYAIGFQDNTVDRNAKYPTSVTLNVFLEGNQSSKPNGTVTLKLVVR